MSANTPNRPIPVWIELAADLDTPVAAYLKLRAHGPAPFLLESVSGGQNLGRYSYLGYGVRRRILVKPGLDPWKALAPLTDASAPELDPRDDLPPFWGGFVGWIGYDAARFLEPSIGPPPAAALDLPEADLVEPEVLVAFDHVRQRLCLVTTIWTGLGAVAEQRKQAMARLTDAASILAKPTPGPKLQVVECPPLEPTSSLGREEFIAMVKVCKEHILAGDIFQAVLSQRFSVPFVGDSLTLYRQLRMLNPSPYLFYLDWGGYQLVGSSPEVMVRVDQGNATVRPIAGTRRRGQRPDDELAADLLSDPKEQAEHLMLVDLGRNDLGRVCEMGSVKVTQLMAVESYSHVMHLVSNVTGRVAKQHQGLEVLAACFPAGTLSGAPKIRAMQILNSLEPTRRGPYGGAIGTIGYSGAVNMGITIRTFLVQDGLAHVQAGAGIVADSDPESEYQECKNKAQALLLAAARAVRPPAGPSDP